MLSAGTNALLRLGATPVTRVDDVLEALGIAPAIPPVPELAPAAHALLERLRDGALTADELVRAAGIDAAQASTALLELELARLVLQEDGVYRAAV